MSSESYAQRDVVDDRMVRLNALVREKNKPEVWWLRPLDLEWKAFKFTKLDSDNGVLLLGFLADSSFKVNAGEFFTLDAPFDFLDKKKQGVLIVRSTINEGVLGFRFRGTNVDPKALEFIVLHEFDPKGRVKYSFNKDFSGVVLKGDFRRILGDL